MGLEIERKFLVQGDGWKNLGTPVLFHQGYLNRNPERSVRVRIEGEMAKINIKAQRGTLEGSSTNMLFPSMMLHSFWNMSANSQLCPNIGQKSQSGIVAGRLMNSMEQTRGW